MREEDIPAVDVLKNATFEDLERRLGEEPRPHAPPERSYVRLRRALATDPGGCWVAERAGEVVACALGLVREGLWVLSLLVVRPDVQSQGLGRAVLERAYAHGRDARAWLVLASPDSRALRAYARLGLTAHPCLRAHGVPRGVAEPPGLRPGTLDDMPLVDAVDRRVRRAAHGDDIAAMLATGMSLLVLPERGYAVVGPGEVRQLAALDEDGARALLLGALARAGGEKIAVDWMTAVQDWAVRVCVEAGLELQVDGAVFLGGDVGPFHPYLPSGSYG
jgi:GNAT superfamily N-acetyltransferase